MSQPSVKTPLSTKTLRQYKLRHGSRPLAMLTCYDFQTAQMLNETQVDMILVGDSLGNVILGFDTTVGVTVEHMKIFSAAVARGAPDKFIVVDMPFGSYATVNRALDSGIALMQNANVQALKLESAGPTTLNAIKHLVETGIPVMGHIGLTPQSVHQLGGFFTHGKKDAEVTALIAEAKALEQAGVFALVLECIVPEVATLITEELSIPTIGIGSGSLTDGQVLVLNDLLKNGRQRPPKFVRPVADFYSLKKDLVNHYIEQLTVSEIVPQNPESLC